MEGYLYLSLSLSLSLSLARSQKGPLRTGLPGDSGYKPGDSGLAWLQLRNRAPGHSEVSGFGLESTPVFVLLFFWVKFVAHKTFSRFSWAQDLNQSLWIKSLLIIRRSYTQIPNIKTTFLNMIEHRLFIPFSRGQASLFDSPVQTYHLHTCSFKQLNIHVFCYLSPKPT